LSDRPAARARQLANLRPAPPAPAGNQRPRTHGAYAVVARERLEEKALAVFDALSADAPLRNPDGQLPAADAVPVRLLAECLCRLDSIGDYLRDFGWRGPDGEPRLVLLDLERRLRAEASDHADALGMTPRSRAKLGLDLQRSVDLSTAMSEPDPARRAELVREAGITDEEVPDDGIA
jgi:hypothetical protein